MRLPLLALLALAGCATAAPALAQCQKLSACPTASATYDGTEVLSGNQDGVTHQFPLADLTNNVAAGLPPPNQHATGKWFSNDSPTAVFDRFNDRVLVGDATLSDGASPNVARDWLTADLVADGIPVGSTITQASQVEILTTHGNATSHAALLAAADNLASGSSAVAINAYARCNHPTSTTGSCWAIYGDAKLYFSNATAFGAELDPGAAVASSGASPVTQGNVVGLQIACGGEFPTTGSFDCSAGIQLEPNPKAFKVGLNIGSNALTANAPAIDIPSSNHAINFIDTSGNTVGILTSQASGAGNGGSIFFLNGGISLGGADSTSSLVIADVAAAANHFVITGGTTGNDPALGVDGTASNINIVLTPRGSGVVETAASIQAGGGFVTNSATLMFSGVALSNAAASSTATLTNAPAAGNPTKWIAISDNGVIRHIPAW